MPVDCNPGVANLGDTSLDWGMLCIERVVGIDGITIGVSDAGDNGDSGDALLQAISVVISELASDFSFLPCRGPQMVVIALRMGNIGVEVL